MISKSSLSGKYKLQIHKSNGQLKKELEFDNMILNSAWTLNVTSLGFHFSNFHLGTGTTPPQFTDTTLEARVVSSNRGHTNYLGFPTVDYANFRATYSVGYQFTPGQATGTFTEVGVGALANGTNLFSRSLIKDSNGNPTSITILADEYLTIVYSFIFQSPTEDIPFTCTVKNQVYNGFMRTVGWNESYHASWPKPSLNLLFLNFLYDNFSHSGEALTAIVNGPAIDKTSFVYGGILPNGINLEGRYTKGSRLIENDNFTRTFNLTLGPSVWSGNFRTIIFSGSSAPHSCTGAAVQVDFGNTITKTNTEQLTMSIKHIITRV